MNEAATRQEKRLIPRYAPWLPNVGQYCCGAYPRNPKAQKRFDRLYAEHLRALKLQGYSESTIDVYTWAVRRVCEHFDWVRDKLGEQQLAEYFSELIDFHSWSTVPSRFSQFASHWASVRDLRR